MNLGELSCVRSLRVHLGEDHSKDEHVVFELEGGENYHLAQMIQCLITFIFLV